MHQRLWMTLLLCYFSWVRIVWWISVETQLQIRVIYRDFRSHTPTHNASTCKRASWRVNAMIWSPSQTHFIPFVRLLNLQNQTWYRDTAYRSSIRAPTIIRSILQRKLQSLFLISWRPFRFLCTCTHAAHPSVAPTHSWTTIAAYMHAYALDR